tara:strand:- start:146 stop:325 length:180 start_codon:yes stop_codon:yes gene_type:complete
MNIESAKYIASTITNGNASIELKLVDDTRTLSVSIDPDNRHYQAIQEWVAEGNKIEEAD